MYTKSLLAALVAAPVAVSAYGSAIVHNQCSSNVYMWSVSSDGTGSMQTIPAGGSYSEQYFKPSNGGVSIKLAKSPFGAFDSSAITQFEYTLDGMIWYDISNINGYPFMDGGVKLVPGEASCPTKICPPGVKYCTDAYNTPDENAATGACSAESNTSFYLCGAEPQAPAAAAAPVAEAVVKPAPKPAPAPAPKPEEKPAPAPAPAPAPKPEEKPAPAPKPEEKPAPAPAPAPAVTSAPAVAPSPVAAVDAGVFTTFVTQVVTVAARDAAPEPTAVPLKRDDSHANMHKRAAHRHHFHRHGDVN